jgi:hypothetical protein
MNLLVNIVGGSGIVGCGSSFLFRAGAVASMQI